MSVVAEVGFILAVMILLVGLLGEFHAFVVRRTKRIWRDE